MKESTLRISYFLVFVHTFVLTLILFLALQSHVSEQTGRHFLNHWVSKTMSQEKKAHIIMDKVHHLLWSTKPIVSPKNENVQLGRKSLHLSSFYKLMFFDNTRHMLAPYGSCGSFTVVLASFFKYANIPFRIAQMTCRKKHFGCHIVLEAYIHQKWIFMDPLFNLVLKTPQGNLASYAEIQKNWGFYKKQIMKRQSTYSPKHRLYYDTSVFDFSGVRYTNWNKIPVVMPAIKFVLERILGQKKTQTLSLRSMFIHTTTLFLYSLVCLYCIVCLLTLLFMVKRRRRSGAIN